MCVCVSTWCTVFESARQKAEEDLVLWFHFNCFDCIDVPSITDSNSNQPTSQQQSNHNRLFWNFTRPSPPNTWIQELFVHKSSTKSTYPLQPSTNQPSAASRECFHRNVHSTSLFRVLVSKVGCSFPWTISCDLDVVYIVHQLASAD